MKREEYFLLKIPFLAFLLLTLFQISVSAGAPQDKVVYHDLRPDQVVVSLQPCYPSSKPSAVGLRSTTESSEVTIIVPIFFDSHWIAISKNTFLLDRKTGDKYYLRSMVNDIPISKVSVVKGAKNNMVELTFVFPPLKRKVRRVDFIAQPDSSLKKPDNGSGWWRFDNLKVDRRYVKDHIVGDTIR